MRSDLMIGLLREMIANRIRLLVGVSRCVQAECRQALKVLNWPQRILQQKFVVLRCVPVTMIFSQSGDASEMRRILFHHLFLPCENIVVIKLSRKMNNVMTEILPIMMVVAMSAKTRSAVIPLFSPQNNAMTAIPITMMRV